MPWKYIIATFIFSIPTGFLLFSKGSISSSPMGQRIQEIMSIICFGFIIFAFWCYGWKIGLLEMLVIFIGANIGLSILVTLKRNLK
jgi:hypothetical protein